MPEWVDRLDKWLNVQCFFMMAGMLCVAAVGTALLLLGILFFPDLLIPLRGPGDTPLRIGIIGAGLVCSLGIASHVFYRLAVNARVRGHWLNFAILLACGAVLLSPVAEAQVLVGAASPFACTVEVMKGTALYGTLIFSGCDQNSYWQKLMEFKKQKQGKVQFLELQATGTFWNSERPPKLTYFRVVFKETQ